MLDRVQHHLNENKNNFRVTIQHFAATGDVEAVKSIFENNNNDNDPNNDDGPNNAHIDIDIHSPKSKNTPLHTALIQNQQGFIIDYLISKGADINAFNVKGFNPVVLAIRHCRPGINALKKLIDAGASLKRFEQGRFFSLSLVDIALQWKNEEAVKLLKDHGVDTSICSSIVIENGNGTSTGTGNVTGTGTDTASDMGKKNQGEVSHENAKCAVVTPANKKSKRKGKAICPLCNCSVKYPTRMSFLKFNQEQVEKEYEKLNQQLSLDDINSNTKTTAKLTTTTTTTAKKKRKSSEIFISRKYLDQFMTHSNGESYRKLCSIEYHGVSNMSKLRKEISESYSILHAVQECSIRLKAVEAPSASNNTKDNLSFENMFLIDLCSGKSLTGALCAVLFPPEKESNNKVLAVDKLGPHMVPHFLQDGNTNYLSRDIMSSSFYRELEQEANHQSKVEGRTVVLVGMHLCGKLSERAIELFSGMPSIEAIVLSPCCLPKMHRGKGTFETDTSDDNASYMAWSNHLKSILEQSFSQISNTGKVNSYNDIDIHSPRNSIITGIRPSS